MHVSRAVKKRLTFVNVVIAITSLIGILSVLELRNGVNLHELNFAHLDFSMKLDRAVETVDFSSSASIAEVSELVKMVREQPVGCLRHRNTATILGTKLIGTHEAFEICEMDLVIADTALAILDRGARGEIGPQAAIVELQEIGKQFRQNSADFGPLVSRTVDAMLVLTGIIMLGKGGLAMFVTFLSSRSILRQVGRSEYMESELHAKNAALGKFISTLERQKQEIVTAKQLAEHNSLHDPLTQLPNRRFLDRKLFDLDNSGIEVALLLVDIDHFQQINDTRGHEAGDYVLVHVAKTLQDLLGEGDFVARVGGDEFAVIAHLTKGTRDRNNIHKLAERIIGRLGEQVTYNNEPCRLGVSVGVALQTPGQSDVKALFVNADIALYRAKIDGRSRYDIYDEEMRARVFARKALGDDLIAALERDEIYPDYQLQFYTKGLDVSGMEALARWKHPTRGMISPAEFLPIAEELGLLGDIDRRMLSLAVRDLAFLETKGFLIPRVSVNISAQRLNDPTIVDELRKLKLPRGRISFELLESVFLDNTDDRLRFVIDAIREMGIELEIDDFGSGHASILGLLEVKPERFKIDRQVIGDMDRSAVKRGLVNSIIGMAQSLEMEVVAEGVETRDHVTAIQETDCTYLQGYALAKPMSCDKLVDFLEKQNWRLAA